MPPEESVEAVVEKLRQLFDRQYGFAGKVRAVVLQLEGGRELSLPLTGGGGEAAPLTPTEASIIAAMRGRPPAKSTVIAVRAGRVNDSHFRRTFKGLQRRGLVEPDPADPHHYRLCASV
jgi:hypothetical protein